MLYRSHTEGETEMAIRIKELKDIHHRAIQLLILHRWEAGRGAGSNGLIDRVAEDLAVKPDTVRHWRTCDHFRGEYDKQLADRRERVKILNDLYFLVDDTRTDLKLKILREIREEVGHSVRRVEVDHQVMVQAQGINAPPPAQSYDEWLAQNRKMEKAMKETATDAAPSLYSAEEILEDDADPDAR